MYKKPQHCMFISLFGFIRGGARIMNDSYFSFLLKPTLNTYICIIHYQNLLSNKNLYIMYILALRPHIYVQLRCFFLFCIRVSVCWCTHGRVQIPINCAMKDIYMHVLWESSASYNLQTCTGDHVYNATCTNTLCLTCELWCYRYKQFSSLTDQLQ